MASPASMDAAYAGLRRHIPYLLSFPTSRELQTDAAWPEYRVQVEQLLNHIDRGAPAEPGAPEGDSRRVVHWNILKGISFDALASVLGGHPDLRRADVLLLNEVDLGMARSANRHVAAELAHRLGLHWAFLPSYLELTKGPGEDARVPGDNSLGLHGVAILSGAAPLAVRAVRLPEIFDYYGFSEKRYGQRAALLASLPGGLMVGTVHLEVRSTPARRATQMGALLVAVDDFRRAESAAGRPPRAILLAGDLNTHTFPRGTFLRSLRGFLRLALTPRGRRHRQLMEPWRGDREPLFRRLAAAGFGWRGLNDRRPTARAPLTTIEESSWLPRFAASRVERILADDGRGIALRLDWFMGWGALGTTRACTVGEPGPPAPSDHAPLVVEVPQATIET